MVYSEKYTSALMYYTCKVTELVGCFQCEFNGDVCFMIRVTIYGKSSKQIRVIHFLEPFLDMNSMVMFVL